MPQCHNATTPVDDVAKRLGWSRIVLEIKLTVLHFEFLEFDVIVALSRESGAVVARHVTCLSAPVIATALPVERRLCEPRLTLLREA